MYQAKELGTDQFAIYTPALTQRASQRLQLETEMRAAIRTGAGLSLAYQPMFDLRSGSPVAVEVLLRWNHERLGSVPPALFVPVAEDIGLMPKLGMWVLSSAIKQLGCWDELGVYVPQMCINVSPTQIERTEFEPGVHKALDGSGVAGSRLVLEVTEEALFRTRAVGARTLRHLRADGVQVAIDDFGEGYSSLSRLQNLPVDVVKIDRAFVGGLSGVRPDFATRRAVAAALIELVHALGKSIVVEGVEDADTANYLSGQGCELAQGFLFSQPLTADQVTSQWSTLSAAQKV